LTLTLCLDKTTTNSMPSVSATQFMERTNEKRKSFNTTKQREALEIFDRRIIR
jgi:hypothetical protein